MTQYNARREFLKKLGLAVGASVAVSGTANAIHIESSLTNDQEIFMEAYEQWMDAFLEVIEVQKEKPNDLSNNQRLMELSEQAANFKDQLDVYLKDESFARNYLLRIERMSAEISD